MENCRKIGEGGLGGPLEIVREEELNDGDNPEMAAIMYQESILDEASTLARSIEQRIEEQRTRLLAIEVREGIRSSIRNKSRRKKNRRRRYKLMKKS